MNIRNLIRDPMRDFRKLLYYYEVDNAYFSDIKWYVQNQIFTQVINDTYKKLYNLEFNDEI
jgi:hypothetical protein